VERDGGRHFLLNKGHALLHRIVGRCNHVDVEIVLSETIKDNLDIAWIFVSCNDLYVNL
jgi:hypothetical protein